MLWHVFCINFTGLDYNDTTVKCTFPRGSIIQYCPITIFNDNLYEGTENFTVTIRSISKDIGVGDPSTATVSITDDECKSLNSIYIHYFASYYVIEHVICIDNHIRNKIIMVTVIV